MKKIKDYLPEAEGEKPFTEVSIKATIPTRSVKSFLNILAMIQYLGGVGASRIIRLSVDGDGAARLKFETDNDYKPDAKELDFEGKLDKDEIPMGIE